MKNIGIIGLGLLGEAISHRLISIGYQVSGFDISQERNEIAAQAGVSVQRSIESVFQESDFIIFSLLKTEQVRKSLQDLFSLGIDLAEKLIFDVTTGIPTEAIEVAQLCKSHDIVYMDTPVSGSSVQVKNCQALLLAGCDKTSYEEHEPFLNSLFGNSVYVGESGSGITAKLATNLILGLNRAALAEGLAFAENQGLDLDSFSSILIRSPAYSAIMNLKLPKMLSGDFSPQGKVSQHLKDVDQILELADKSDLNLPLSKIHQNLLSDCVDSGYGELDNSSIFKNYKDQNINSFGDSQ